jgi:Polysaccharide lyase
MATYNKLLFLFFLCVVGFPSVGSSAIIYRADWNDGTLLTGATPDLVAQPNGCCSYSHRVSSTQSRDGGRSVRFESRSDDPFAGNAPGKTLLGWNGTQANRTERWYGFWVYFDPTWDDDSTDPNETIIIQWHRNRDACDTFSGQHLAFTVKPNNDLIVQSFYDANRCNTNASVTKTKWNLGPITKGVWTHFVVHAEWSTGSDGVLEVWENGVKVIQKFGPNYVCDGQNCTLNSFIRFGIYKSWWSNHFQDPADRLILYFDRVKIGDENSSYNEVN